jgi:hypothetical protein
MGELESEEGLEESISNRRKRRRIDNFIVKNAFIQLLVFFVWFFISLWLERKLPNQ